MNSDTNTSKKRITNTLTKIAAFSLFATSSIACSSTGSLFTKEQPQEFLDSGTIIISKVIDNNLDSEQISIAQDSNSNVMTPLIGFFPPTTAYVPAVNEAWLEVDSTQNSIKLHVGSEVVEQVTAQGLASSLPGNYFVTQKVENPTWRANDQYFTSRGLSVPSSENDSLRMRKGALGKLSIQSSNNLNIHSAALWTNEVGGLRIPYHNLSSIFEALPVGAPILVK